MKPIAKVIAPAVGAVGAATWWRRHSREPEAPPVPQRTSKQLRAEAGLIHTAAAGTMGALSVHSVEERRALKARLEASAARLETEAGQVEREGR